MSDDSVKDPVPTTRPKHETNFQKNWRPSIGWAVAAGFAFSLVVMHLLNVVLKMLYWKPGDPVPQIDKPDTMLLLEAAAVASALGAYRMYEKVNGAAGNTIR